MNRKLFFEDGSVLEVEFNIINTGSMAIRALQRLTKYLDEELIEEFQLILQDEEEDLALDEEELEDIDELEEDWLDDEDYLEEEEFDEELDEEWEDEEDEDFRDT
jgi:hypothetical protein